MARTLDLRSPELRARDDARPIVPAADRPAFTLFSGPTWRPETDLSGTSPWRIVAGNAVWNNSLANDAGSVAYWFRTKAAAQRALDYLRGLKRSDTFTTADVMAAARSNA